MGPKKIFRPPIAPLLVAVVCVILSFYGLLNMEKRGVLDGCFEMWRPGRDSNPGQAVDSRLY
jgi:hypothetical protein